MYGNRRGHVGSPAGNVSKRERTWTHIALGTTATRHTGIAQQEDLGPLGLPLGLVNGVDIERRRERHRGEGAHFGSPQGSSPTSLNQLLVQGR